MPLPLAPLGTLYGAVVRTRLRLYRSGFLKTENVGAPVISVGNITAGGTGKTPLVEWVARAVAGEGRRPPAAARPTARAAVSSRARRLRGHHARRARRRHRRLTRRSRASERRARRSHHFARADARPHITKPFGGFPGRRA